MKKLALLSITAIAVLFFISCANNGNKESKTQNQETLKSKESFDWLLGNWKKNNEEGDLETFEIWKKKNDSSYYGIGFTMHNKDTLSQEKIKLIKRNSLWVLEVIASKEAEATLFSLTKIGDQDFICENEEIDFPKKIKYWKSGEKINALVSGDEMEIPFEFERIIEK